MVAQPRRLLSDRIVPAWADRSSSRCFSRSAPASEAVVPEVANDILERSLPTLRASSALTALDRTLVTDGGVSASVPAAMPYSERNLCRRAAACSFNDCNQKQINAQIM